MGKNNSKEAKARRKAVAEENFEIRRKKVLDLSNSGATVSEIVAKLGLNESSVRAILYLG